MRFFLPFLCLFLGHNWRRNGRGLSSSLFIRCTRCGSPFILALLLLCSAVQADDPPLPILIVSDSGYSWMIQGDDGTPVVYKFSQVVVIGKPPQGVPTPSPTAPEFGLAPQVPTWLATVKDQSDLAAVKTALSSVVTMAATKDKLKTLGEVEAVTGALLANSIKNKSAWSSFGTSLNQNLVSLQSSKKIVTPADYGRAINEVLKALP